MEVEVVEEVAVAVAVAARHLQRHEWDQPEGARRLRPHKVGLRLADRVRHKPRPRPVVPPGRVRVEPASEELRRIALNCAVIAHQDGSSLDAKRPAQIALQPGVGWGP